MLSTIIFILFLLLLVGGAVFMYVQYQTLLKKAQGKGPSAGASLSAPEVPARIVNRAKGRSPWKAAKIEAGLISCRAAEAMRGKVYLIDNVPEIPLKACRKRQCQCRYVYLDDRRDGTDRRETSAYLKSLNSSQIKERRQKKDRRRKKYNPI